MESRLLGEQVQSMGKALRRGPDERSGGRTTLGGSGSRGEGRGSRFAVRWTAMVAAFIISVLSTLDPRPSTLLSQPATLNPQIAAPERLDRGRFVAVYYPSER